MKHLSTYAEVLGRLLQHASHREHAIVLVAGLHWSVFGEFTTSPSGSTATFIASDVRLVNDDGSETTDMLDHLAPMFVAQLEQQVIDSLLEGRRAAP
ncbi:hypothetical protein [Cupriavidus sp. AcVe19-1a]|uniref:hypothetical protein n=1 Tax=Cupriavidus sp. AcVe19-1a TaxID=2821359 RepID=UPI001AE26A75|nr:hypothetical protein [Cupriavidus sp. AcVe19-1a]MBP0629946.1 hypothetical protein [Cupriavidus sp. AcVe19-1a]